MKNALLRLAATSFALTGIALTAQPAGDPITDPIPELITTNGVGIQLVPWVQLGAGGAALRINGLKSPHDGSGRLFAIDQAGPLHVIDEEGSASLYLDMRTAPPGFQVFGGQTGFTYLTFHPEFETNGIFFTVTSAPTRSGTPDFLAKRPIVNSHGQTIQPSHHDIIHRWQAADPGAAPYAGEEPVEILRLEQPYDDHNIGMIDFRFDVAPDHPDYGLLYIAVANGGSDGWPPRNADPQDHGQDITTPYAAHLRIDPLGNNSANGKYGIPTDNPWAVADSDHLPEIWTYGHRNPHRFSWDPLTGNLYSFEIGQWFIEEINLLEPGGNYGWGVRYGNWVMDPLDQYNLYPLPNDDAGFTYPVAQYAHPGVPGQSASGPGAVTDGHVYRGGAMPDMWGRMIFADFAGDSRFFYLESEDLEDPAYGGIPPIHELEIHNQSGQRQAISQLINGQPGQRTDVRISIDEAGELYVSNKRNGWIYQIVSGPNAPRYAVEPTTLEVPSSGGESTVTLTLSEADAGWTAISREAWISIVGEPRGSGSGSLRISTESNPLPIDRTGLVTINGIVVSITQSAGTSIAALFPNATLDGERDWTSPWFGVFRTTIEDLPWIWHTQHGWLWTAPVVPGESYWFYEPSLGWYYASSGEYPWIYLMELGRWGYFSGYGSGDERWFWINGEGWSVAGDLQP